MANRVIVGGLAAALLVLNVPVDAYHITGFRAPPGTIGAGAVAQTAHNWDFLTNVRSPADEPCAGGPLNGPWMLLWTTLFALPAPIGPLLFLLFGPGIPCLFDPALEAGDILLSSTICESDDVIGLGVLFGPVISKHGNNGLCYMSPGHTDDLFGTCAFIGATSFGPLASGDVPQLGGRSNGFGPNYDAVADPQAAAAGSFYCEKHSTLDSLPEDVHGAPGFMGTDFYTFEMVDGGVTANPWDVPFLAQVGGLTCTSDSVTNAVTVDMVAAYMLNGGHVAGHPYFPPSLPDNPAPPWFLSPPINVGTYRVTQGQTEFGACPGNPVIFN